MYSDHVIVIMNMTINCGWKVLVWIYLNTSPAAVSYSGVRNQRNWVHHRVGVVTILSFWRPLVIVSFCIGMAQTTIGLMAMAIPLVTSFPT